MGNEEREGGETQLIRIIFVESMTINQMRVNNKLLFKKSVNNISLFILKYPNYFAFYF